MLTIAQLLRFMASQKASDLHLSAGEQPIVRVHGDLQRIDVPALVIGGAHDTMDPAHLQDMARRLPQGTYLHTEGSHLALYDDQETYMRGLVDWLAANA